MKSSNLKTLLTYIGIKLCCLVIVLYNDSSTDTLAYSLQKTYFSESLAVAFP